MSYKYETKYNSPNFTRGADAQKVWGRPFAVTAIAIHWWGDPKTNPTYEGVIATLVNPNRGASAHFVATGTGRRVAQLVNLSDASWATNSANPYTISIECDPRCRPEDYDVVAELIAQIRQVFGKNLPLVPHKQFVATQCPGNYDLNKLSKLADTKLATKEAKWGEVTNKEDEMIDKSTHNMIIWGMLNRKHRDDEIARDVGKKTTEEVVKGIYDWSIKKGINFNSVVKSKDAEIASLRKQLEDAKKAQAETPSEPTESPSKPSEGESGTPTQPDTENGADSVSGPFARFIEALKKFWNS